MATAPGRGGIGVVRVSGPRATAIAEALCGLVPEVRVAQLATFAGPAGEPLDHGLVLRFCAPHSFTGEDVVEFQAHGSPVTLAALVRRACGLGARLARAGEFSERAFLNGKLDLAQAEAVADLIAASSDAQARAALRSLDGEFSHRIEGVRKTVIQLQVEVEAAIDFAEDAAEGAVPQVLAHGFAAALAQLAELLAAARRGVRLTDGLRAVIVGAPNVGKSSLLNALAGSERAIVTAVPGTTRDVLRETLVIGGVELVLADTAGLRDATDAIEGEGIRRAQRELADADLALVVRDGSRADAAGVSIEIPPAATRIDVCNKLDLAGQAPWRREQDGIVSVGVSARTGAGLDLLREALLRAATRGTPAGAFSARGRHVAALERAAAHLAAARGLLATAAPELIAEELRSVQTALGEITGAFTNEDLLGAIFSTFCVGK